MRNESSSVVSLKSSGGALPALPLHCLALFLGSFLLFAIQPMFTKMILPLLGGTPAVWNTAVMFFQAMLLGGYLYAHLLSRLHRVRWQVLIHASALAVGLLFLPVRLAWTEAPSSGTHPVAWLVALLTLSIGLPFFAVSATAPLLQRWFSRSGHVHASDPYFLYVSSNIGGLAALLAYPVVIEPLFGLALQSHAWAVGYGLLAVTIILCAISLRSLPRTDRVEAGVVPAADAGGELSGASPDAGPPSEPVAAPLSEKITSDKRLHWVALSFIPSALLLGTTQHISTDVASAPFLWIVPLSLYMLSFIIVFARRPILKHEWMLTLQIPVYALVAVYFTTRGLGLVLGLHLLTLFVTAMVCHGELVRHRPAAKHLTEFYLWMSVGGLLGGVFCVLVAPVVFNSVFEYPLVLTIACLLRPESGGHALRRRVLDVGLPALLAVLYFVARIFVNIPSMSIKAQLVACAVVAAVFYSFRNRPLRLALGFAPLLFGAIYLGRIEHQIFRERSFFGVYTVSTDPGGRRHFLHHGNILHGDQWMDAETLCTPLGYYIKSGPLWQAFTALRTLRPLKQIGCVGLGAGTVACYQGPGESVTFYEVDTLMERIARDPKLFRYLDFCKPGVPVVIGDGRQSVTKEPDGTFDLLLLDAFSSDAIPVHLMTREALRTYMRKLAPAGVVMFHISNRYLDLEPALANLAIDSGLSARIQIYDPNAAERVAGGSGTTWVAIARTLDDLGPVATDARWRSLKPDPAVGLWTDDYSNLFRSIMWKALFETW